MPHALSAAMYVPLNRRISSTPKERLLKRLQNENRSSRISAEYICKNLTAPVFYAMTYAKIRNMITLATVAVRPTQASKTISFILSPIRILTLPPVAWKKEP